jgi:2-methylcitrate dehydratase PrpD
LVKGWGGKGEGTLFVRQNLQADAQFSAAYTSAAALVRKDLFIDDFSEAAVRDPVVGNVAQRVTVRAIPPEIKNINQMVPVIMKVRLKDGRTYEHRVDAIKGHPLSPMTRDERLGKFRRCAAHAARPIPATRLDRVIELVEHMEEVQDVSNLVGSLTATASSFHSRPPGRSCDEASRDEGGLMGSATPLAGPCGTWTCCTDRSSAS